MSASSASEQLSSALRLPLWFTVDLRRFNFRSRLSFWQTCSKRYHWPHTSTRHERRWLTDSKNPPAWNLILTEKNNFLVASPCDVWACCQNLLKGHSLKCCKTFGVASPKTIHFRYFRWLVAVHALFHLVSRTVLLLSQSRRAVFCILLKSISVKHRWIRNEPG